jgi:hypothetical protein
MDYSYEGYPTWYQGYCQGFNDATSDMSEEIEGRVARELEVRLQRLHISKESMQYVMKRNDYGKKDFMKGFGELSLDEQEKEAEWELDDDLVTLEVLGYLEDNILIVDRDWRLPVPFEKVMEDKERLPTLEFILFWTDRVRENTWVLPFGSIINTGTAVLREIDPPCAPIWLYNIPNAEDGYFMGKSGEAMMISYDGLEGCCDIEHDENEIKILRFHPRAELVFHYNEW